MIPYSPHSDHHPLSLDARVQGQEKARGQELRAAGKEIRHPVCSAVRKVCILEFAEAHVLVQALSLKFLPIFADSQVTGVIAVASGWLLLVFSTVHVTVCLCRPGVPGNPWSEPLLVSGLSDNVSASDSKHVYYMFDASYCLCHIC